MYNGVGIGEGSWTGQSGQIRGDHEHTGGHAAATFQNPGHIHGHPVGESPLGPLGIGFVRQMCQCCRV